MLDVVVHLGILLYIVTGQCFGLFTISHAAFVSKDVAHRTFPSAFVTSNATDSLRQGVTHVTHFALSLSASPTPVPYNTSTTAGVPPCDPFAVHIAATTAAAAQTESPGAAP